MIWTTGVFIHAVTGATVGVGCLTRFLDLGQIGGRQLCEQKSFYAGYQSKTLIDRFLQNELGISIYVSHPYHPPVDTPQSRHAPAPIAGPRADQNRTQTRVD